MLQDALAAEEHINFSVARVQSAFHSTHPPPIVVDQYDVCALVNNKSEFQKTKVAMLQHLCKSLEFEVPVPAVKRKAPLIYGPP